MALIREFHKSPDESTASYPGWQSEVLRIFAEVTVCQPCFYWLYSWFGQHSYLYSSKWFHKLTHCQLVLIDCFSLDKVKVIERDSERRLIHVGEQFLGALCAHKLNLSTPADSVSRTLKVEQTDLCDNVLELNLCAGLLAKPNIWPFNEGYVNTCR